MRIYDVSASIYPGMSVYPGDPETTVERVSSTAAGEPSNVSVLKICSHAGTHVDPPLHLMEGGAGVDGLPLEAMIGPALVLEVAGGSLDRGFLESAGLEGAERVIFKTGAGDGTGADCPYLDADAAGYLVELGVRLVGTCCLSIESPDSPGLVVHRTLLGEGIVLLEGLDLTDVGPGEYGLICLPIKIRGGDGAPARVVLTKAG